jgi:uncharacterized protein (TIGR02722 family)
MKKFMVCCAAALLVTACASGPTVSRVDSETDTDLTGKWNDKDVNIVCESLINSALSSPRILTFINEYADKNGGKMPTVVVGSFKNESSEHIDTSIISSKMETAIINSGRLEFVAGGDTREELRTERIDQQYNASEESASGLGKEVAAVFMLNGTVKSMVEKSGTTTVRSYIVSAVLTNIETNSLLWKDENSEIKKVITQPKAKF